MAAGLALVTWAVIVEPRRMVVRRQALELPSWPAELDGLRLVLLADLHAGAPQIDAGRVRRIVARVNALRPDLVVVLGDVVDHTVRGGHAPAPELVAEALGGLRARHGALAVLGNHDWLFDGERVRRALQGAGLAVLEDEARPLPVDGVALWIAGLADLQEREPDIDAVLAEVPPGAPVLLLSHNPDVFPQVPARVALTVSGHTHGGQVDLPGLRGRAIPSRFGDRYSRGHVVEGGRHLFVTSGVGTSRLPIRLGRPPEAVLLVLDGARRRRA